MKSGSLKYEIIDECKCGFEELFVLFGLVDHNNADELDRLAKELVNLHRNGYLACKFGSRDLKTITRKQLNDHIQARINKREKLESYPQDEKEFSFFTTEKGRNQLADER